MRFEQVDYRCALLRLKVLLALSLAALVGGCGRATGGESKRASDSVPPSRIIGVWEWVRTTGGALGDTVTPGTSGRSYRLEVLPGERYRQISSADGVSDGTYTAANGFTFNQPDVVVPVLRFDQPLFKGYFGPVDEYAVLIRGDTLNLKDTYSHPWVHQYLRAGKPR
jgi:hypothetical protein